MKNKSESYSQINFSVIGFIAFYAVRVLLFIPLLLFINIGSELKYKWFYSAFFIISIFSQYFVGMERLLNYFYPVYLLIVVEIIYKHVAFFTLKRNLIVFFSLLHIYFILDYKLFNKNENGQYYYSLFFPYESILDPKIHPDRELFYNNQW